MTQIINFLPDSYHRRRQKQRKRIWRRGVFVVFVALIAAGALGQWRSRLRLESTRDGLQRQVSDVTARLADRGELQRQVEQLDFEADLIAYLRVRIPPTRVLADVVDSLPKFVALTELRAEYDRTSAETSRRTQTSPSTAETEEHRSPAEIDFEEIRQEFDRQALFVTLAGIAPDDMAIARFLKTLERTNTFDRVQLLYTDRHSVRDLSLRKFGVRLRVKRPGTESPKAQQRTADSREPRAEGKRRAVRSQQPGFRILTPGFSLIPRPFPTASPSRSI